MYLVRKASPSGWQSLLCPDDQCRHHSTIIRPTISYVSFYSYNRELKQRERQKSYRFRVTKQQLCTCITLSCTFLCRRFTTTTWKCLILRFVEDVNTRQRLSFSLPELWYSPLEFNSRKICQHLTNWTSWNKRDKAWSCANSLFEWRFRSRRRLCCLSFLTAPPKKWNQRK